MIPRYSLPEMAAVWSDEARLANWLEIELLAVEAWAELGVIPAEDAAACRARAAFTVEAVAEREAVTRHDVAAFVDVVAASDRPRGPMDPLRHDLLRRARHGLRAAAARPPPTCCWRGWRRCCSRSVKRQALAHRDTPIMGRSHGVHAEPTSFGHKLAVWAFELDRDRERLRRAREAVERGRHQRRRRHLRRGRSPRRGVRVRAAGAARRRGLHPGRSSATATPSTWPPWRSSRRRWTRWPRRSVTSRARRCARCRSRSRRGRRDRQRHAAQAEPRRVRARERAGARGPRARAGGVRERGAVARARHLALLAPSASILPDATACSTSC